MTQADAIRAWIIRRIIAPARASGLQELEVQAGDVHDRIGLRGKVPNVCNVLGGRKLADEAGLELMEPRPAGPKPNALFRFRLLPTGSQSSPHQPAQRTGLAGDPTRFGAAIALTRPAKEAGPATQKPRVKSLGSPGPEADRGCSGSVVDPDELAAALVLVSCVKSKRRQSSPARDVYVSDGFRKARRIAEQATEWRILSAKHGLVHPDTHIEPYETTLNAMGVVERRQWAGRVLDALVPLARRHGHVIILAGQRYRADLVPALMAAGVRVSVPMDGLRQGEQLAWLGQHAARLAPRR